MAPNWFFGVPLDGSFILSLPGPPHGFRRFHPDDVHFTLAFLGACGKDAAERALSLLDERLRAMPPAVIDATLGAVVPMGSPRHGYTALSALLERGNDEATAFIAAHRDALADTAGVRRDRRPPKPHVTIARPRRRATKQELRAGLVWAGALDLSAVTARIDRVRLYTWAEDRRERLFTVVAERRFRAA